MSADTMPQTTETLPSIGQTWRPTRFVEGEGTRLVFSVDEHEVGFEIAEEGGQRWFARHRHWHEWVEQRAAVQV